MASLGVAAETCRGAEDKVEFLDEVYWDGSQLPRLYERALPDLRLANTLNF